MAPRPDHRVRTNDAVACQRDPVRSPTSTPQPSRHRASRRCAEQAGVGGDEAWLAGLVLPVVVGASSGRSGRHLSTTSLETVSLLEHRHYFPATLNGLRTLIISTCAAAG